jgi:hypothetical protein
MNISANEVYMNTEKAFGQYVLSIQIDRKTLLVIYLL